MMTQDSQVGKKPELASKVEDSNQIVAGLNEMARGILERWQGTPPEAAALGEAPSMDCHVVHLDELHGGLLSLRDRLQEIAALV